MVFDKQTEVHVPVFYILLEGKQQADYYHALYLAIVASKWKLEPSVATCDFERGLINKIEVQFPSKRDEHGKHLSGTKNNGCLFRFKQAIRRKLVEFQLSVEFRNEKMKQGSIDLHTVVPISEIREIGMPFLKRKIRWT